MYYIHNQDGLNCCCVYRWQSLGPAFGMSQSLNCLGGPQVCFYTFGGCVVSWAKLAAVPAKLRHRGLSALTVASSMEEVGVQRPTQVGEGGQAHRLQKMAGELVVKKQNFQTRSGLLWFPELSFLLEVKGGGTAYNPKALKSAHRKCVGGSSAKWLSTQRCLLPSRRIWVRSFKTHVVENKNQWPLPVILSSYPHACVHTQDDKINIKKN